MKNLVNYLALIPVVALTFVAFAHAPKAFALSCIPIDMYLESVAKEEGVAEGDGAGGACEHGREGCGGE